MIVTIKRHNSDHQNHDQSDAVGQAAGSDSVATTKSLHVTNLLIDKGPSRSYRYFEYHSSDDDCDVMVIIAMMVVMVMVMVMVAIQCYERRDGK